MTDMKPGDLVYAQYKLGMGREATLSGWGTVCWVEADKAKIKMDRPRGRPPLDQIVSLSCLQTPEEVPQRWACRILGLELAPGMLNEETGRIRSGIYVKVKGGRTVKLMVPGVDGDESEPFMIDRGSAIGVVFLEPETFKYLRYEGVGLPPTDIEAEQDALALNGPSNPE